MTTETQTQEIIVDENAFIKGHEACSLLTKKNYADLYKTVKLQTKEDKITLTATDTDIHILRVTIPTDTKHLEQGYTELLPNVINFGKSSDNFIGLTKSDGFIINQKKKRIKFNAVQNDLDFNDFEATINKPENKKATIQLNGFVISALTQAINHTSKYDVNSVLGSVCMEWRNNELSFYSTDGNRLYYNGETSSKAISMEGQPFRVNIHKRTIVLLKKLSKLLDFDKVNIVVEEDKIYFVNKYFILQADTQEGLYPNVRQLIPNKFEATNSYDYKHFVEALTSLKDDLNPVTRLLHFKADSLEAPREDVEASAPIVGNDIQDPNYSLYVNGHFLIECLKTFKCTTVDFYFSGKINPIIIRDTLNSNEFVLLMPIKHD